MRKSFVSVMLALALTILISSPELVRAVEEFKVSFVNGAAQIWFEAEAFDERNPEGDQYFKVTNAADAFGKAVTRAGGAGGTIRWTFDITPTKSNGGNWFFWGRIKNPNNQSDYLLVEGDPDDKIPDGPPFPGGDAKPPFSNPDDRIFEEDVPNWRWCGGSEGCIKSLDEGENTMYIFHRQGDGTVFWDVFMWTDDRNYMPSDEDYQNARSMKASDLKEAVQPLEKLSTTWGKIKV